MYDSSTSPYDAVLEEENPLLKPAGLPPGFVLDQPATPAAPQGYAALPEGFVVDQPPSQLPEGWPQQEGYETLPEDFKIDQEEPGTLKPEEWDKLPGEEKKKILEETNRRDLVTDVLNRRKAITSKEFSAPENWASLSRQEKTKLQTDFQDKKQAELESFDITETERGRGDLIESFKTEKPQNELEAFADEISGRFQAAIFSPTAGIWDVGSGLIDTISHGEAVARGVRPEDTTLHHIAQAAREGTKQLVGDRADTFVPQLLRGFGSTLAYVPAGMAGGLPGVALQGALGGFGPGYFEAKEKAAALGRPITEGEAYTRALVASGLGATEGLPIGNALNKLDKFTGDAFKRVVNSLTEGGEEWVQEYGSNVLQGFYDKLAGLDNRQWKEIRADALSDANMAALSGVLMGVGMNALEARAGRSSRAQPAVPPATVLPATAEVPPPIPSAVPPPIPGDERFAPPVVAEPVPPPVGAPVTPQEQLLSQAAAQAPTLIADPEQRNAVLLEQAASALGGQQAQAQAAGQAAAQVPGLTFETRDPEIPVAPEVKAQLVANRLDRVNDRLVFAENTGDTVGATALRKERVDLENKVAATADVTLAKETSARVTQAGAPKTAQALESTTLEYITTRDQSVHEAIDMVPEDIFAPEPVSPTEPRRGEPGFAPPSTGEVIGVGVPVTPAATPAAAAPEVPTLAEAVPEVVIRPGIKGQEAVVQRPSAQIQQELSGAQVDVEVISTNGEKRIQKQDAAQALMDLKKDQTGFRLLIDCIK